MNKKVEQIAQDARQLGICPGDVVLVHSSLRALGVGVTPEDVIAGLRLAVGENGTLVFPALSYFSCNREHPYFDYKESPSNVGAIPEYFRTQVEGVLRSMNPTHSCCAWGPQAAYITEGHCLDTTPCGPNSPYRRLYALAGKILFLGCGTACNTSMHAVEELIQPSYLFAESVHYIMIGRDGKRRQADCRAHDFRGVVQRYDRLPPLLPADAVKSGKILAAQATWMQSEAMWKTAECWYRQDPYYFVDRTQG